MSRRANGEGTVYERKDGRGWKAEILLPLPDGTHKRITASGKTRQIALKRRKEKERAALASQPQNAKATVADIYQQFIASKRVRVSKATIAIYTNNFERVILPAIGYIPSNKLAPAHIETMLEPLLAAKKNALASQCRRNLSALLNWAVRQGYIASNPCHAVDPIKQTKTPRPRWQPADAERFLIAATDTWYFPVLFCAIMTGLRRGELQALQWQDIDGDRLYVRRTYSKHGREIKTTKTAAGIRTIPLGNDMQTMLERQRQRVRHHPEDFVFPSMTGSMLSGDNMLRAIRHICERADIPRIRFHDLRVFAGSLIASQTHDPAILQAFLGHSDPRTSLAIYRQVMHFERATMALERSDLQITTKTTTQNKKDETP